MKTLLVGAILFLLGGVYLLEHPPTLTLTPLVEVATSTSTTPSKPKVATSTPKTPAATPKKDTAVATTPAATSTPKPETPTPSTPAPATSTPTQKTYAEQVAALVLEKTNRERTANGLSALTADATLASVARGHSADMQSNHYFSHTSEDGCDSSCRADKAGYAWRAIGENIYMMSGFTLSADAAAEKIVQGWMNSPGHRANILREVYTHSGVGVVAIDEDIYATALYATPR